MLSAMKQLLFVSHVSRDSVTMHIVLNVENVVDSSSDDENGKHSSKKATNQFISAQGIKKKNKKKKKAEDARKEINEMVQNLSSDKHGSKKVNQDSVFNSGVVFSGEHLEKSDEKYASGEFEEELQLALAHSKEMYDKMKQTEDSSTKPSGDAAPKKKKKEKPITMSLDQFTGKEKVIEKEEIHLERKVADENEESLAREGFFTSTRAEREYKTKLQQQQKQQKAKKVAFQSTQNIEEAKFKKQLEAKMKEIAMLQDTGKKLQDELQQVKKRNQQLGHILGQGEMKEKTAILMEIADLQQIQEELKSELGQRKSELEEEKQKVQSLKLEVNKLKASKHGNK